MNVLRIRKKLCKDRNRYADNEEMFSGYFLLLPLKLIRAANIEIGLILKSFLIGGYKISLQNTSKLFL